MDINGGPCMWCARYRSAISVLITNGAPDTRCVITSKFYFFYFSKTINGAPGHSAPLLVLTSNGAPHTLCATTNNFFYFFLKTSNGAPV